MLSDADAVQQNELIQQNEDSLLHFVQTFLILFNPIPPACHRISQQQIASQLLIKKWLKQG